MGASVTCSRLPKSCWEGSSGCGRRFVVACRFPALWRRVYRPTIIGELDARAVELALRYRAHVARLAGAPRDASGSARRRVEAGGGARASEDREVPGWPAAAA